jgi:hypothetical protein
MRMVLTDFLGIDLFVRFEDDCAEAIYSFVGRDKSGKDKFRQLKGVFTEQAEELIYTQSRKQLAELLEDEAAA